MTEQDNHITPDQNTPDNNTTEQTTTQLNAPHYITKSTQHNTKNLPLQVLGSETSAVTPMNKGLMLRALEEMKEMIEAEGRELPLMGVLALEALRAEVSGASAVNVLGMTGAEVEEERARGYWVSPLMGALGRGEIRLTEGFEIVPAPVKDWWKDEKGEI